jgi:simple sugar transport system substrate-binding protein
MKEKTGATARGAMIACGFLLIAVCCLVSCRKEKQRQTGLILGFSQIGAESAWRTCNSRSVQEAAAAAGIQLLFSNAEQKQENQIKAIRSFIAYQVDVIAFVPIVSDGWENVLEEAKDAGIPVLVCDRKITIKDQSLYAGYIGTDSEEEGRRAAEFLLNKYARNPPSPSRPVRIIEIRGTEGSSAAIGRTKGFRERLENINGYEIIYSESGDFLRSKGYELMCSILDDGDITINSRANVVIFSHNDGMTLGALDAMKERGISPGIDVVIISVDAEQAAIDALKRGEINCVVECNPMQGPDIMLFAERLAGGKAIPRVTNMAERVFYEGEDLSELPPRGY